MNNVYPEIGSAFGSLAIQHPVMCQHLIGKNIKHYGVDHVIWGTDCLWWGSPQWVIEAFKRFQISDELCEKFGYAKLTKEDKAKIFGLNAAQALRRRRRGQAERPPGRRPDAAQAGLSRRGGPPRQCGLRVGAGRCLKSRSRVAVSMVLVGVVPAMVCQLAGSPGSLSKLAGAQPPRTLDPSAWGGDHVGRALPEFTSGDECLFCHRPDRGPGYAENDHCRSLRPADEGGLRPLQADPALKASSAEVVYTLGGERLRRFLKPAGEAGKLDLVERRVGPREGRSAGATAPCGVPAMGRRKFRTRLCRLSRDGGRIPGGSPSRLRARLLRLPRRGRPGSHERQDARAPLTGCAETPPECRSRSVPSAMRGGAVRRAAASRIPTTSSPAITYSETSRSTWRPRCRGRCTRRTDTCWRISATSCCSARRTSPA